MTLTEFRETSRGKVAEVLGIGVSNLPLIDFLLSCGMTVRARDKKSAEALGDTACVLKKKGVELVLGEDYLKALRGDYIFRSPGIRPDRPEILEGVAHGAVLTSEMELFLKLCPATVIAITGSDGKTTTTTLTGLLLREAGYKVYVGGNIGTPLLPFVEEMTENDFAVLELSSFQLMTVDAPARYAALTNLAPNHLDWHTGMEEYIEAKTHIFKGEGNKVTVLNADNVPSTDLLPLVGGEVRLFSSAQMLEKGMSEQDGDIYLDGVKILSDEEILLPGRHNRQNYMTAYNLVKDFVPWEVLCKVAKEFGGVEHRLEFVREYNGVKIYNSSIDSSPSRTAAALSCFKRKVVCICGGYDKGIPFAPLAEALSRSARVVVLTGATAGAIKEALDACTAEEKPTVLIVPDFEGAVLKAVEVSEPEEALLLSPGCASFDAFPNFMVRGQRFKEIIRGLCVRGT